MNSSYLFLATLIFVFANIECSHPISTPSDDISPGKRNYIWTIDTIYAPFNSFLDISGVSPKDLWTANPGDAEKIFFHFDGSKWSTDLLPRVFSPKAIFAKSATDIWSSGQNGKIWHYDGIAWKEYYQFVLNGTSNIVFEDIFSATTNDVYAVGQYYEGADYYGVILHFDGAKWSHIKIPNIRTAFYKIRKSTNNNYYLMGLTFEESGNSTFQIYSFDGTTITELKKGSLETNQNGSIVEIGDKLIFIIGFSLYDFVDNRFIKIGDLAEIPEFLNIGIGRSIKDVFLGMRDGIAHYNGTNVEYLVKTDNDVFVRYGAIFENDIFMIGGDSKGNNLIFHGVHIDK